MNNIASPQPCTAAAARILTILSEPGAFARRSAFQSQHLALFRRRQGLTLGAGQFRESDCAALLEAGLVAWTRIGAHQHLVICAAGLAARHHQPEQPPQGGPAPDIAPQPSPPATVNLRESPLAWLHRRKARDGNRQISDIQFMAGERLRSDMEFGRMLPRVTANWSAPVSGASGAPASASDSALAARERVASACSVVGPEFSGLLIDVCGFLKGLEQVEFERDWPARSAKLLLRLGLDRLARHYGLTHEDGPAGTRPRPQVWRAAGARPVLLPAFSPPAPDGHRS